MYLQSSSIHRLIECTHSTMDYVLTNPSSSREAVITYEVVSRGSPWPTTIFEITSSHDHQHHWQQIENLIPRIWNFPCTQSLFLETLIVCSSLTKKAPARCKRWNSSLNQSISLFNWPRTNNHRHCPTYFRFRLKKNPSKALKSSMSLPVIVN